MMALSTKRLYGWAGSIRKLFKMDGPGPTRVAGDPLPAHSREPGDGAFNNKNTTARDSQSDTQTDTKLRLLVEEPEPEMSLSERMETAKELYPGSRDWAKDEERLFEILFLRQDLPMLPSHWNVDFRGFPIPENIFETSDEHPAIIYAHSKDGSKEFSGKQTPHILKVI